MHVKAKQQGQKVLVRQLSLTKSKYRIKRIQIKGSCLKNRGLLNFYQVVQSDFKKSANIIIMQCQQWENQLKNSQENIIKSNYTQIQQISNPMAHKDRKNLPQNKQYQNIFSYKSEPSTLPEIPVFKQNPIYSELSLENCQQSEKKQIFFQRVEKKIQNQRVRTNSLVFDQNIVSKIENANNNQFLSLLQPKLQPNGSNYKTYEFNKKLQFQSKFGYKKANIQMFTAIQNCIVFQGKDPLLDIVRQSIKIPTKLQTLKLQSYYSNSSQYDSDLPQQQQQSSQDFPSKQPQSPLSQSQSDSEQSMDQDEINLNEYPDVDDPKLLQVVKNYVNNISYDQLGSFNLNKYIAVKKRIKEDELSYQKIGASLYKQYYQNYPKNPGYQFSPCPTAHTATISQDNNVFSLLSMQKEIPEIKTVLNFGNDEMKGEKQKKRAKKDFHICMYCWQIFQNGFQLGGHTSKKHPGRSVQYQNRKIIENKNILDKNRREYFKAINDEKKKHPDRGIKFQSIQKSIRKIIKDPAFSNQLVSEMVQQNVEQTLKQQCKVEDIQQCFQKPNQKLGKKKFIKKQPKSRNKNKILVKKQSDKNFRSTKKTASKGQEKEEIKVEIYNEPIKEETISILDLQFENSSLQNPIICNSMEFLQENYCPNFFERYSY